MCALLINLSCRVWSLILCHDKPKTRVKQVEKFVDVADVLATMDNFAGLRAVIAGINHATPPGDSAMKTFMEKFPAKYENFRRHDTMLQSTRAHKTYRMQLRAAKGAAIPTPYVTSVGSTMITNCFCSEVHIIDLIKSHEGNPDVSPVDPTKIHWAKWNMIAKFIDTVTAYQHRCRTLGEYNFQENQSISELWEKHYLMDEDVCISPLSTLHLGLQSQ
jgi:hypothetical protein